MQQIINFIIRNKISLLYVLLMVISLGFTIQSHSYHKSKYFNSSNWISGTIYKTSNSISSYFNLSTENEKLLEENKRLKYLLYNKQNKDSISLDSTGIAYTIVSAKAIKNSYSRPRNYITINKGSADSIQQDMGVITEKGILGIVEDTSNKFASVQSILNTKSNINAKLKNTNYFGSLVWNTEKYNIVQLADIPRLVQLQVGDTVVTGGMSSIFPENIPIGRIIKFDLNASKSSYNIDIALFNDMANIGNVYIINNIHRKEIKQLEAETENVQ